VPTRDAVERWADEIDMVIDVASVRMGDPDAIAREVSAARAALPDGVVLKTIIERPPLDEAAGRAWLRGTSRLLFLSAAERTLGSGYR
jgi:deoxyribose-phosphate aldolase